MLRADMRVILSPQAEEDFTDILQHTLQEWGEAQVPVYGGVLDKALLTIQHYPKIGKNRPEISPKHRVFSAGRHMIVYWVGDDAVYVSRILHERMDVVRHM